MTITMTKPFYDLVVVGGGVAGLVFLKRVAENAIRDRRPISALLLESGLDLGRDPSSHKAFIDRFHQASIKTPNSPYLVNNNAPVEPDYPGMAEPYYVHEQGKDRDKFSSNTIRALGGTTMHWMGLTPRMLDDDFKMKDKFDRGVNWPIDYDDLRPYYRQAEIELGVSGNAADQHPPYLAEDEFPMEGLGQSHHDKTLKELCGDKIKFNHNGRKYVTQFSTIPQARNSTPRENYAVKGGGFDMESGAGQRCEGNASCIPICPVNAKYSALRTFSELQKLAESPYFNLEIQVQSVVSTLNLDTETGDIESVNFIYYPHSELAAGEVKTIEGRNFVLAASAIENAKILLMSGQGKEGLANRSGEVGRNLMDHPFVLNWGYLNGDRELGTFRGPGVTSDLPIRTGPWRAEHAAFRTDVSNWGWGLAAGAPYADLERLINPKPVMTPDSDPSGYIPTTSLYGRKLREQLRYDVQRQVTLGYLFEQLPRSSNQVRIDPAITDRLGVCRPIISYALDDYTLQGMQCAEALTQSVFKKAGITNQTRFETALGSEIAIDQQNKFKYIGAGHIMGTHRMGSSALKSVVNSYQKSWDHHNLYIIGSGSFPTAGTANPTLTLAALSLRTADDFTNTGRG